jgi:hypothetical protein
VPVPYPTLTLGFPMPYAPAFPVLPLAATETETWQAGPLLSHVRSKSDAIRECRRAGFRVMRKQGMVELGEGPNGPAWIVTVWP